MTLQKRIGMIFFLLSVISVFANFIFIDRPGSYFNIIECSFLMVVFSITIAWESTVSKIIQVISFLIAAFFALYFSPGTMFGPSILITEILVLYAYGFFNNNAIYKILISSLIILIMLFVTIPEKNEAFMWFVFIIFILTAIFVILYDKLKLVYNALEESVSFSQKAMQFINRITRNGK